MESCKGFLLSLSIWIDERHERAGVMRETVGNHDSCFFSTRIHKNGQLSQVAGNE